MNVLELSVRLVVAFFLGGIIGLERQWHQRTAGIRTNALVCIGACGFVIFATLFPNESSPTRIAAQIVSGIGFLGAGVIMREGFSIIGLNSAATIWCASTVGVFCAAGYFIEAATITGMIMTTNLLLRQFVANLKDRFIPGDVKPHFVYVLSISCTPEYQSHFRAYLVQNFKDRNIKVKNFDLLSMENKNYINITVTLTSNRKDDKFLNELITQLTLNPEIMSAKWLKVDHDNVDI